MIILVPMTAGEFPAYVEQAIPKFAQDKVASGQWAEASALELSRQGLDELLPGGVNTPDNFLFTVREASTQAVVGALWFANQEQAGRRIAYVYDVLIEPRHRRKGYATSAFHALDAEVRSRGLSGIALHAFGHNDAARALYAKLGYRATNIVMFKDVPKADS